MLAIRNIKDILDEYSAKINVSEFIENDPVKFVHKYTLLQDIEVAGLLTAINAWGRRDIILKDVENMLNIMGKSPYDYILSANLKALSGTKAIHRTFQVSDMAYICRGLRHIYSKQNSLENYFVGKDMFDGIKFLREDILSANDTGHRCKKHISDPQSNSACKRLHLYLRWMVRNDGIVDIGVWKNISPANLYIPLDVHVGRVSRHLKLITRKQNDKKTVEELTAILRKMNPDDPILYDFGLFGIGEQKIEL